MITEEILYEMARIIDGNFYGSRGTFTCKRKDGAFHLTTNRCDSAGLIKVYTTGLNEITQIEYLNEDTDGFEPVSKNTMVRVGNHMHKHGIKIQQP